MPPETLHVFLSLDKDELNLKHRHDLHLRLSEMLPVTFKNHGKWQESHKSEYEVHSEKK